MNPVNIEMNITSDPCNLPVVRAAAERLGALQKLSESEVHSLAWAVDEALANVIKHGYKGSPDQPIKVSFSVVKSADGRPGIAVEIRDHGCQVDPGTIHSRPLDDVRPGGLGVHIIQTVMDEHDYSCPEGGGMMLRMVKYKSCCEEAPKPVSSQNAASVRSTA